MATNKRVFTLRLSDEVFDKIGALATREHRSITNYIEFVLLKHLETLKATCFPVRQHGGERCWNRLGSPNPVPISPFGNGEKSAR